MTTGANILLNGASETLEGAADDSVFATAMTKATTGYVALMGGSVSYNASTGALTGTVGTSGGSVTLTQSHGNSLLALLNTVGTNLASQKAADLTVAVNTTNFQSQGQLLAALRKIGVYLAATLGLK